MSNQTKLEPYVYQPYGIGERPDETYYGVCYNYSTIKGLTNEEAEAVKNALASIGSSKEQGATEMTQGTKGLYQVRKPKIHNEGLWATHDMACAVCKKNHAILDCQTEIFFPCWQCQKEGWRLQKAGRFEELVKRIFRK